MKDTINQATTYFADTYALIEIIKGNKDYKKYINTKLITTRYNLIELFYHCIHHHSKEIALIYFRFYSQFEIPITEYSILTGMEFKLKYKSERLSYVDCIGYALALELGIKFLTGDQKFKDKENVEFAK